MTGTHDGDTQEVHKHMMGTWAWKGNTHVMGTGPCHGDLTVPQGPCQLPPAGVGDSEVTLHRTDGQGRRRGEGGGKLACLQGVTSVTVQGGDISFSPRLADPGAKVSVGKLRHKRVPPTLQLSSGSTRSARQNEGSVRPPPCPALLGIAGPR